MPRPDFRAQAAERLAAERTELTPAIFDLLSPEGGADVTDLRRVRIGMISANPDQPRQHFDQASLEELAASIREHGVLQPVLLRPQAGGGFQLIAGERRWRAAKIAGLEEVPAIVEEIDDESAMEIAIIENLQREDISLLDEADMFERMTSQHGYSLRKLAQKLGKDKGYIENRLRLADAPPEIRELVSVRRDTLSAAYELMKVESPRKRKRLAAQVASGELSLVKLRQRIEGRAKPAAESEPETEAQPAEPDPEAEARVAEPGSEPELVAVPVEDGGRPVDAVDIGQATEHLAAAVEELTLALMTDATLTLASSNERQSFAKYLTIAKIKLDNAIAVVRSGEQGRPITGAEPVESAERRR